MFLVIKSLSNRYLLNIPTFLSILPSKSTSSVREIRPTHNYDYRLESERYQMLYFINFALHIFSHFNICEIHIHLTVIFVEHKIMGFFLQFIET